LTAVELSELSLLCTLASSLPPTTEKHGTNAAPNSSTPDKQPEELGSSTNGNGFAAVEGDQLVELIELLDRHVSRATGINLLKDVVVDTISKENAPSAAIAALGRVSVIHLLALFSFLTFISLLRPFFEQTSG